MHAYTRQRIVAFLESWLAYRFRQTTLPGLSIAVSYKQDIVFAAQHGLANIETPKTLDNNALFGVASQSKMMTAVALLQLCEKGSLALDVPVRKYIPWLTKHPHKAVQEITTRQLLTHSAGFTRDLPEAAFWILQQPFPNRANLRRALLHTPIVAEPNTQLKYSNAAYALLGDVIEAVSDQSYTDYITKHIIKALGLTHTLADYGDDMAVHVSAGYSIPYGGQRSPLGPRQATRAFASAAGVHSTCVDMCRFVTALCDKSNTLLSTASKKEMMRTQWMQTDGYDAGMEFGLGIEVISVGGRRIVGHSGHIAGHVTATYIDPQSDIAVAVMANSRDAPSSHIALGILAAIDFFSQHALQPAPAATERLSARLLSPIAAVEIVATKNLIVAIDPDDWQPFAFQEELVQLDASTLRIVTPGSVFNQSETVQYKFSGNAPASVSYAGNTLWLEQIYEKQQTHKKTGSLAAG
ncbi:MAG TPA: serine hydrolase domain-containing protein [Candidatus Saccharimonadales bacterium]|nr:serine hydrolase domain-containing protein [Candidatus Saccharimonadales bacterium]